MPFSSAVGNSTLMSTAAMAALRISGVAVITASASMLSAPLRLSRATLADGVGISGGRADVGVNGAADPSGDGCTVRGDRRDRHQVAGGIGVVVAIGSDRDGGGIDHDALSDVGRGCRRGVGGREHHRDVDGAAAAGVGDGDGVDVRPRLHRHVAGDVDHGRAGRTGWRRPGHQRTLRRSHGRWRWPLRPLRRRTRSPGSWSRRSRSTVRNRRDGRRGRQRRHGRTPWSRR